jgi:hypothetical protein
MTRGRLFIGLMDIFCFNIVWTSIKKSNVVK